MDGEGAVAQVDDELADGVLRDAGRAGERGHEPAVGHVALPDVEVIGPVGGEEWVPREVAPD
jgi:hypothetical protein